MAGTKSIILILLGSGLASGAYLSGIFVKLIDDVFLIIGAYSVVLINKTVIYYL